MSPRARSGAGHAADEHFILPRDQYIKQSDNGNPLNKSTSPPVTIQHVLKALEETNGERDIRIHKLFNLFDVANTGHLENYAQIEAGLSALGKPTQHNTKYAKDIFLACDANQDGQVDYQEFRRYVDEKELELYRIFQAIDIELDGCISFQQLSQALAIAGIEINEEELACFIDHVAKDNNGTIFFEEWRNFLLFYPHEATIKNIYQYLESACPEDMSDSPLIPEDITKDTSKYLMLGGIAGATSRTATAPLDRIKVVLQVQTSHARIVPAIKDIWREGGFRAFFRGNGLNVLKVAPETAIRFYTYEMMKNFIHYRNAEDTTSDISTVERLIAGGTAGALAQTIIYPMDLMKTRLQTYAYERGKYIKLDVLLWFIWIQEGPRAFYRGLVPSLIGIIPFAAIDFAAYEALKDISRTYAFNDGEPGPLIQVGCGTISGALGASCVYPLQVIRTRMQAQRMNAAAAYKGMSDVFWRTLQHEGFRGFYKGILPNLLKVVPSASITYLVFETMKRGLDL